MYPIFMRLNLAIRLSDRVVISIPSRTMVPSVGRSRPAISPSRVDFPLPDGPITATICFGGIDRATSSSIVTRRPPAVSRMERCRMAIIDLAPQ